MERLQEFEEENVEKLKGISVGNKAAGERLPDEGSIYPPPVLRKDIMKLQLFMGCFARKKVRHDSTNSSNGNSKK